MVEKCDLIHKSQLSDIEQIIYYLKNRKNVESPATGSVAIVTGHRSAASRTSGAGGGGASGIGSGNTPGKASSHEAEKATIRNIDEYIELLYEDLPEKIKGSRLILQLARDPDNLGELEKNGE